MSNSERIRPRKIDEKKSITVIKDLSKAKLNASKEEVAELCNIEKKLYKVIDYYDNKKKIDNLKTKMVYNNDKNNSKNHVIIINNNENLDNSNIKENPYILNYKLTEYKRPDNYILYSSHNKNIINSKKKKYEGKEEDKIFLELRNNFMKIEEFENLIYDLEINVTNKKDFEIDEDKARAFIEQKYPKYKKYADTIIFHFKDRRNETKKSLLREKWHANKSNDKYLKDTFTKRIDINKIKVRNNQNNEESLNKIIEAEDFCKKNFLSIIKEMYLMENLKKEKYKLDDLIFRAECNKITNTKISIDKFSENNNIKKKIEKNIELIKEEETANIASNLNENKLSETKNNINQKSIVIKDENNNKNSIENVENNNDTNDTNSLNKNEINNKETNSDNKSDKNKNHKSLGTNQEEKHTSINIEEKDKCNQDKNRNKNIVKEPKIRDYIKIFPPLSLSTLLTNKKSQKNYLKEENSSLRVRIRMNRNNKITVDRYIQTKNDFNPFHDSFNDIIYGYKKYDNSCVIPSKNKNFENLLDNYNSKNTELLDIFDDTDEDSYEINNEVKTFSNNYKKFLKLKREHS